MISGSKVHQDDLDKLERTEKEAMDAMKNKDFVKVIVYTIVFYLYSVHSNFYFLYSVHKNLFYQ